MTDFNALIPEMLEWNVGAGIDAKEEGETNHGECGFGTLRAFPGRLVLRYPFSKD